MKSLIPNALTALNLVFGIFALAAIFNQEFVTAVVFIVLAMIADSLDGRVARYLQVSSEFGKELDSLCDLVSFGVAPAILAYVFYLREFGLWGYGIAAVFATCGALRLARFNVNTGVVKGYFMGLPIPAGGCLLAAFTLLGYKPPGIVFPVMVTLFAYLMVSTIHYPDFKGKGDAAGIAPILVTLAAAGGLVYCFPQPEVIPFVVFAAYAVFGIISTVFHAFSKPRAD